MTSDQRSSTRAGQLARLGFIDTARADLLLETPALALVRDSPSLVADFSVAADPDLALALLGRFLEACQLAGIATEVEDALLVDEQFRTRILLVLGASEALGEHLIHHPDHWDVLGRDEDDRIDRSPQRLREDMVDAVACTTSNKQPWLAGAQALRVAYRRELLAVVARDLSGVIGFATVTSELADLADAVLAACLELAKSQLPADAAPCRLAIIAMGKCGGRELNYVSDVDVIFVAEPGELPDGSLADEAAALATATELARGVIRAANEPTAKGTIWEVDAALRPEGKAGALVRTLASHVGYYERWAQTWEFQALLKARFAAGDAVLGLAYTEAVKPFVWSAADRDGFVSDVQDMRRRVEQHLGINADRELKLGKGGLRDVEFSVQLLQLVHGRSDVMLRSPTTLTALEAMATWGYVGREDAATLAAAYRFLRSLEHRLQLYRLQRTHMLPAEDESLRRLGRSLGLRRDPAHDLMDQLQKHRVAVRRLHEKLFYRPLLNAVALLDAGEARLTREAARERLMALGYLDPEGALRHIEALTSGVSRRAAIQRTLLPVMLGWFADAPNPDAGLLAFRKVSEALGGTPWYLRLLRDETEAAQRMARILATSRYTSDLLLRAPDGVALLSDTAELAPKSLADLRREMDATITRHEDPDAAMQAVRGIRQRELLRVAAGDICGVLEIGQISLALASITDATIGAALSIAQGEVAKLCGGVLPTKFAVVALGRLGGYESGYGSDADVVFVHDPLLGVDDHEATKAALAIANELRRLIAIGGDPRLELDCDLRPEGRSGPLVRSLASYAAYYSRWSAPWEYQALLRARALAGDGGLLMDVMTLIDGWRWPVAGISDADLRETRRLKARMESERLPRGADPAMHVKLGPGGLSDVEWVAQLMQMQHAGRLPALRSTDTLTVLRAAVAADYLSIEDSDALCNAWAFATRIRNSVYLVTGRPGDQIPTDLGVLAAVAYLLGYPAEHISQLSDDYLRLARRARGAVERLFYGWADEPKAD